jgi:MoaA/NifB/PqqE/SkfB family radical SAM enzyme
MGLSMNDNVEEEIYSSLCEESLSIEVTTHCNSACLHCFARGRNSEHYSLPIDLVKEIIIEGYNLEYRDLHITGGEPLLWEGLYEALDFAFGIGYKTVFMNTNGTLLTEDTNSRLSAYDGLSISISLEAAETIHEHLRGDGSYLMTVQGIEKALNAGIELVIFTTIFKSILPDLPHFVDDLYKKFSSIKHLTLIQLIKAPNIGFDLSEELLEPEDFLQLVRAVALLNLYGLKTCLLNNPLACVALKLLKMPWMPRSPPLNRERSLIVMANRDICLSHSSKESFGKYESGMIQKILASDQYQEAVSQDKTTCPSCKYQEVCMENGMVRPSEYFCESDSDVPYCIEVLDSVAP